MLRSMTGFGEAERTIEAGLLRVELKSVNHRNFNTTIRTPYGFDRYEPAIQGWLKEYASRGHLTISVSLDSSQAEGDEEGLELDLERAEQIRALLQHMAEELNLEGGITVDLMAGYRDLIRAPDRDRASVEVDPVDLEGVIRTACEALVGMREREGAALAEDLEERLAAMSTHLAEVERLAPGRLDRERIRLREAIEALAGDAGVDEDRLVREIAHMADKWDVNEEIVRFRAHIDVFRETMGRESAEPVGKRLGFLVQEMLREANTIGSKANDTEIAHLSVALKEEIERVREQMENVE
jgi:uncharacterized protein (TIGR00255 family)